MKKLIAWAVLICVIALCQGMCSLNALAENDGEYAMFPHSRLKVTQVAYDSYSHSGINVTDVSASGSFVAPFSGTIVWRDTSWGYVVLQSDNKVYYADGSYDYMCVGFMHDNDISDLPIGKKINQGQAFYQQGVACPPNFGKITGAHVQIACIRGKLDNYSGNKYYGNVYIYDALWLPKDIIVDNYGYSASLWHRYPPESITTPEFRNIVYPKTYKINTTNGWFLQGGSVVSDSDLKSIRSIITRLSDMKDINDTGEISISGKSFAIKTIDTSVKFSYINTAGNYAWRLIAKDSAGKTLQIVMYFEAVSSGSTATANRTVTYPHSDPWPPVDKFEFRDVVYPKTFKINTTNGWFLDGGTVEVSNATSNATLKSIRSIITRLSDMKDIDDTGEISISGTSYAIKNIDSKVLFNKINTAGQYAWRLIAKDSEGKTLQMVMYFEAVSSGSTVTAKRSVSESDSWPPTPICEHAQSSWKVTKDATCTTAGERQQVCNDCGTVLKTETVDALGHDWGDWTVTKAATCTEKGQDTRVCKRDVSHTETRETQELGHDWGDWTVTKAATCTEKGQDTRECKRDASHTETRETQELGHDWGDWVTTKEPTATEAGEKTRVCKRDGTHKETESIPPVPQGAQLTATATAMQNDGTFTVTLGIQKNPGIAYIGIGSDADEKGISIENVQAAGFAQSWSLSIGNKIIALYSTSEAKEDGSFLTLKMKSASVEEVELTFTVSECYNLIEQNVSVTGKSVQIKKNSVIPGDCNNDGVVDGRDLLRLARFVVGQDVTLDEAAADLTGDGNIDGRDVLRLAKQLVNM